MSVLLVERTPAGAVHLTLNRSRQMNSLDRELGDALLRALLDVADDRTVRAVLITGTGPAFCAGDDLAAVRDHLAGEHARCPVMGDTDDPTYTRIIEAILAAPVPVIAALNGASAGAGTEIACAADLRLASDQARIGSCLINVAQVGTAAMLPRVIGESRATEMYLSGRLVHAEEALAIGLVHRIVPHDQLVAEAAAVADSLAAGPTRAIALFKELRERQRGLPPAAALRLQNDFHLRTTREVADSVEGALAFVERRAPVFTGS